MGRRTPPVATIAAEPRRGAFPFIHSLALLGAPVVARGGSAPSAIPTPEPAVGGQAALDTLESSTEALEENNR